MQVQHHALSLVSVVRALNETRHAPCAALARSVQLAIAALVGVVILTSAAKPAFAENTGGYCDDLWFSRNQIMDRAGYCFSSRLGQSIFDNSDCTGTSVEVEVEVEPEDQLLLEAIREQEAYFECRVNTRRTRLEIEDVAFRLRLDDLPAPMEENNS